MEKNEDRKQNRRNGETIAIRTMNCLQKPPPDKDFKRVKHVKDLFTIHNNKFQQQWNISTETKCIFQFRIRQLSIQMQSQRILNKK